ncbi:unnamed protein product, partial [Darwinula stevensoni]
DSILDIRQPVFGPDGKLLAIKPYMESFPFPFYLVLRNLSSLPRVLGDALRQWFELISSKLRDWSHPVGLTGILRHMTDILVQFGASKDLVNAVGLIWTLYLSRLRLAFPMSDEDRVKLQEGRSLVREVLNKVPLKLILRLTIYRLVEVLYLGVLVVRDPNIFLFDILRWIREGHIPFLTAGHFLPDGLHYTRHDINVFALKSHVQLPTLESVNGYTYVLGQFLCGGAIPSRGLPGLLKRLIRELSLPVGFLDFIKQYIGDEPPMMLVNFDYRTRPEMTNSSREVSQGDRLMSLPNYEGRMMALIIVALKALFCFDGVTEKQRPDVQTNAEGSQLFVYSDWFEHVQYRNRLVKMVHPFACLIHPKRDFQLLSALDLHALERHFTCYSHGKATPRHFRTKEKKDKKRQLDPDRDTDYLASYAPSLYPNRGVAEQFLERHDALKQLAEHEGIEIPNFKMDILRQTFDNHSIDHLIPMTEYWMEHDKQLWYTNRKNLPKVEQLYEEKFPSSFRELLNLCAETVEMADFLLYREIVIVEKFLLHRKDPKILPRHWKSLIKEIW